ncbi:hypothetical protein HMPREF9123_0633 [Neisseria bacilliformis ATCC BAA-1200]|uniref:Uncharacterized protein n=1 Tax=Neisseria bacilliformis ATCC BAA-1200 TaxID=888742 RepID=F2BA79_9NEIS|nr:hypothetical protein HMPREF9123_0633 [Neisseria bacilliformis ATCC BAA-1200]
MAQRPSENLFYGFQTAFGVFSQRPKPRAWLRHTPSYAADTR